LTFDPIEALKNSASYLHDLRAQFGNLGLAAAKRLVLEHENLKCGQVRSMRCLFWHGAAMNAGQ
jgi:hypothetical protein